MWRSLEYGNITLRLLPARTASPTEALDNRRMSLLFPHATQN
jgi:hypothetical protein